MKVPYPISLLVGFAVMLLLLRLFGQPWPDALEITLLYTAIIAVFDWFKCRYAKK